MATKLAAGSGDSEKITINLGYVDLGSIDLLVRETVYANRSDFIRTAIRNQLEKHQEIARQVTSRDHLVFGISHFTRAQLEGVRNSGEMLDIRVLGLASIGLDVSPDLACATIRSLKVLGALHAPAEIKSALADRIN